ncbi:MAG TPA: YfhO family protein, partial [Candidatus Kryptobacter bacterium]|nr:YfhO family protein [Candidatus Kryptobacter bacterium]
PMQYGSKASLTEEFTKPDYVSFIQQDSTLYRVLQLQNLEPMTSNTLSYYSLQNAYGYSAAKLRNYQNMMDVAGITNPNVLRLLGVRYIVSNQPDSLLGQVVFRGSQLVLRNNNTLPRAFFVDNYKVAPDLTILESLRNGLFDPAKTVYFRTDPHLQIDAPDSGASVKFTDYKLQSMELHVHATGNNFLLLSEVYYPKGWEAFIDDKPTEIYQSDYFLRGLYVPKGDHTIRMEFHPNTYYAARDVSLGTNIILLVGLIGVAGYSGYSRKQRKNSGQPSVTK